MSEIFDKIVFAVLATLVSTFMLYNYNVYSKAFETVQAESHTFSVLVDRI